MPKQRANLTSIGQFLGDTQQPYLEAPLVAAPFTSITDMSGAARRLPDPSQTLKPALGIERVVFRSIVQRQDETTSTGQQVWEPDNKDPRFRFVGFWRTDSDTSGARITPTADPSFVEITFYGTGLNIIYLNFNSVRTVSVSVDGGSSNNVTLSTASSSPVLSGRNYAANNIASLASNLTLGLHTIRASIVSGQGFEIFGFEILNTSSSNIVIPRGSVASAGMNNTVPAQTTTAFNSGFDGNPALNGRGGRVVMYATPEGRVGKVIQQVDASTLTLSSTNHTNEELIRRINFREFAANRADDFSGTFTNASRAFTLDDGTTSLVGQNITTDSAFTGRDSLAWAASTGFILITFIGTGLDIEFQTVGTATFSGLLGLTIDAGAEVTFAPGLSRSLRQPIVSGLPYGTHTVRVRLNTAANVTFSDFYVYGPKKPSIPDNAIQIAEYNLMANFAASTGTADTGVPTGVLRKAATREMVYFGTWSTTLQTSIDTGVFLSTATNTNYFEYTFFGTGVVLGLSFASIGNTSTIQINGSNYTGAATVSNGGTWNPGTSTVTTANAAGNLVTITGLTLGLNRVRVTKSSATDTLVVTKVDVITPIHFPANKVGSMSIADLDLINRSSQKPVLDLSKAKAWVQYDGVNQRILSSFNISAALRTGVGSYVFYFEKNFKSTNYSFVASSSQPQTYMNGNTLSNAISIFTTNSAGTVADAGAVFLVFFGEQEGE